MLLLYFGKRREDMDEQNRIYIEKEPSMKYFNFVKVAE
jgi:hypothetical protein